MNVTVLSVMVKLIKSILFLIVFGYQRLYDSLMILFLSFGKMEVMFSDDVQSVGFGMRVTLPKESSESDILNLLTLSVYFNIVINILFSCNIIIFLFWFQDVCMRMSW